VKGASEREGRERETDGGIKGRREERGRGAYCNQSSKFSNPSPLNAWTEEARP
jgi:hypothetical protein